MDQNTTTVLLTCLSYADKAVKAERLAQVSAEQWRAVAVLARQHNVTGLLYHHLKLLRIALPTDLAKELQQAYVYQKRPAFQPALEL